MKNKINAFFLIICVSSIILFVGSIPVGKAGYGVKFSALLAHDFYYSGEQYRVGKMLYPIQPDRYVNISGKRAFYTECVDSGTKPTGKWKDYRYVGTSFINQIKVLK